MPIPCFPHQITAVRNVTFIYKVTEHIKIMRAFISSDWANTVWKSDCGDGDFVKERGESLQEDGMVVPCRAAACAELHPWDLASMYLAEEQPGRLENPRDSLWLSQQSAQWGAVWQFCSWGASVHCSSSDAPALRLSVPLQERHIQAWKGFYQLWAETVGVCESPEEDSTWARSSSFSATGNVSFHSKPCEDGNTNGCFPSQSHPAKTCCLTIDL